MLRYIAEKCSDILVEKQIIQDERKNIYIYGCELLISTVVCISFLLLLSLIFGYIKLALIFLVFFMPIRIFAGGYHARTYRNCFLMTNAIALGCVGISSLLIKIDGYFLQSTGGILSLISIWYIWFNAPIRSSKHPLKPTQRKKNQQCARIILIIEIVILFLLNRKPWRHMYYTAMVTTATTAVMMIIANREGQNK